MNVSARTDRRRTSADVVVIGGGILGSSLAVALAHRGRGVLLADDPGGDPASRRSFAWLNAASAASAEYVALRSAGLLHHLVHDRTLGERSPYRFTGSLSYDAITGDAAEPVQGEVDPRVSTLRAKQDLLLEAGSPARLVSAGEAQDLEPGVDWSAAAEPILFSPLEGSVDLGSLMDLQREELQARGGAIVDARAELLRDGDGTAVRLEGRILRPRTIVVAAGASTGALLEAIGMRLPHRSSIGAVVTVPSAGHLVRRVLRGPDLSLRPTGSGDLLIHGTRLDRLLGRHAEGSPEVAAEVVRLLDALDAVLGRTVPRDGASLGHGVRPVPADGLPVVGEISPGLHVLFSHSGATLALVLADLLAASIVDGAAPRILRPFAARRFGLR